MKIKLLFEQFSGYVIDNALMAVGEKIATLIRKTVYMVFTMKVSLLKQRGQH